MKLKLIKPVAKPKLGLMQSLGGAKAAPKPIAPKLPVIEVVKAKPAKAAPAQPKGIIGRLGNHKGHPRRLPDSLTSAQFERIGAD